MTDERQSDRARARSRYFGMVAARITGTAGAVFGLVLLGRATQLWDRVLGLVIVLAGLYVIAVIPRALAHRWRSRDE